jgi:hypothetical protein
MTDATANEHPWTEHVDTLLRWWRFLIQGIGAAWAVLLVGAVIVPRTQLAEATVALPNLAFAEPKEFEPRRLVPPAHDRVLKPGIPIGTYKKVEAALSDGGLLTDAFRELDAKALDHVRRDIRQIVSPMTTGVRDELMRADREDTVIAVRLSFSDTSAPQVLVVVNTLARLVREAMATRGARDQVEAALLQATSTAEAALTRKLDLSARNESLKTLALDLQRLTATAPASGTSSREVVDLLSEGGHRYLPAAVQHVGVKAWQADNDHEIRQADWTFRVESLRVAFYRRLESRLRGQGAQAGIAVVEDVPSVIDAELKAFTETQAGAAADYLRAEVEGMRDVVQAHRAATAFIQRPSLRTTPRAPWVLGGMLAAVVAVLLAALMGESWRRYHQIASARA